MRIVTWNVASLPPTARNIQLAHGSLAKFFREGLGADIVCLQEVRMHAPCAMRHAPCGARGPQLAPGGHVAAAAQGRRVDGNGARAAAAIVPKAGACPRRRPLGEAVS